MDGSVGKQPLFLVKRVDFYLWNIAIESIALNNSFEEYTFGKIALENMVLDIVEKFYGNIYSKVY